VTGQANRCHHTKRSDACEHFSQNRLVLGLTSFCRDAFRVPSAAFFSHFDQKSQGQRRVSLRNALEICSIDALTVWTFSGVLTLRGRPDGFRFNVDPVALMFKTHSRIVFRSGTGARRPSLKCLRNALCVAITDSLFLKNVSTTKPWCSPDQPMALSENGKTTANQRDPSHHCTPSTARAVTHPNVGVISAASCNKK